MSSAKAVTVLCCLLVSAGVVITHATGRFYPWLPASIFATTAIIGLTIFTGRFRFYQALPLICGLGVTIRWFISLFPASMIGLDPDGYAVTVASLMNGGSLGSMQQAGSFYSQLGGFHVLAAIIGKITGTSPRIALAVIGAVVGIMFPLVAAILARAVAPVKRRRAAGFAATVAAVAVQGVQFSFWPIAQVLAVLVWATFLLVVYRGLMTPSRSIPRRWLGLFVLTLAAAAISHKSTLFMICAALGIIWIFQVLHPANLQHRSIRLQFSGEISLILLTVAVLSLQWLWVTNFAVSAIIDQILPLFNTGLAMTPPDPSYGTAVLANSGIQGVFERRGGWGVIAVMGAISGAYLWLRNHNAQTAVVTGAGGAAGVLAVAALSSSPSIGRFIYFGEVAFAACIGPGVAVMWEWGRRRLDQPILRHISRVAGVVLILTLLLSQTFAAGAVPDRNGYPRQYLNQAEVDAKIFAARHVPADEAVSADYYYASEAVDYQEPLEVNSLDEELLNSNLTTHQNIIYRSEVEVYRMPSGPYRLHWNPESELAIKYNNGYDNGEVVIYSNISLSRR